MSIHPHPTVAEGNVLTAEPAALFAPFDSTERDPASGRHHPVPR